MTRQRLRVHVEYYQYLLAPLDADIGDPDYTGNGLVWVNEESGAIVISTGLDTGDLDLEVQVVEAAPPLDTGGWDEVVETSAVLTGTSLFIGGPTDDDPQEIPLPAEEDQARSYRVRVHARGRDAGRKAGYIRAEAGDALLEYHRIVLWPASPAPEEPIKLTDDVGAQTRQSSS
ncbi:hypothetical protein [Actinocorallia libanotica]|uniref:Uncharacterized protein n=1 Tax=Actinocorallia libanotica TaxID=46162 RepID=A0ABP4CG65_9ACTN